MKTKLLLILFFLLIPQVAFAKTNIGIVGNQIKDLSAKQRNEKKISALSKIPIPISYNYQGIDIIITEVSQSNGRLKVMATASKDGVDISLSLPYYYINPPICIPDGTKETVTDEDGTYERNNFKEDILEALKEIVGQTVMSQVR